MSVSKRKFADIIAKPNMLLIGLPICILAVRVAYATIPDANSPESKFNRLVSNVMKNDPEPGIESGIPLGELKRTTVVVYLAKCECNHEELLKVEAIDRAKFDVKIMMPVNKVEGEILKKSFAKHLDLIIFDYSKVVGTKLNMNFVPRVFVVDSKGKLLWLANRYEKDWMALLFEAMDHLGG